MTLGLDDANHSHYCVTGRHVWGCDLPGCRFPAQAVCLAHAGRPTPP